MFRFYLFMVISAIMAGVAAYVFTFSIFGGSIAALCSFIAFLLSRRTYSRDRDLYDRIYYGASFLLSVLAVVLVAIAVLGCIISQLDPEIMPFRPLGIAMFVGGVEIGIAVFTYCDGWLKYILDYSNNTRNTHY